MNKTLVIILLIAAVWLQATSCRKTSDEDEADSYIVVERDALGAEVGLSEYPRRIVSMAPNNTEILLELGARDRLVGVSSFYGSPARVRGIECIGGYINPSLEKIMALEPDIVFAARGNPKLIMDTLRSSGIKVFAVDVRNLDDLFEAIGQFGRLINEEKRASALISSMRSELARIESAVSGIDVEAHPEVLWIGQESPLMTAGPDNMINELIHQAGGRNAARNEKKKWPTLDLEKLLMLNPEIIIVGEDKYQKDPEKVGVTLRRWRADAVWKNIEAVKRGKVYFLATDLIGQPSPRNIDGLKALLRFFHPGIYRRLYSED